MPLYEINNRHPRIGKGTWIAPSAEIIGDVEIGEQCYVGFGAVIRGDFGSIRIGNQSLVEENVVIHTAVRTAIGSRVIIGHMAMIHDAVIHDRVLIGMKSMICEGSVIEEGAMLAEQSLVRKNQKIPSEKIFAGSPAVFMKEVTDRHREMMAFGIQAYLDLIEKYHRSFRSC
ncbi:MAG: gamma carbonic anhydrase family protein [Deltaproteobacteria bacterium]|nr:MAG: gamma carbonic anhydrase family protein [Deltaproteobacteria bacterium]